MSRLPTSARPHFVTGKLAAQSLRDLLDKLVDRESLPYTIEVLPITVAALMTPDWIAQRIQVPESATHVVLPGYCQGDLTSLTAALSVPVLVGPRDLHALPEWLGRAPVRHDFGDHRIEILAEINHAPQMSRAEILALAKRWHDEGADVIDLGCNPGHTWSEVGDCVAALVDEGMKVSIDSMNVEEVSLATSAGASLVLSVNSSNVKVAADWGAEVIAVPDDPKSLAGLESTLETLDAGGVAYRIDPILEPIGFGFAASLMRYGEVRRRYPEKRMMMGIGNLTELTECDSGAVNVLLMAYCEELGIDSVLTTEVIPWAASSVRECDIARRLVHYAVRHGVLPKHLEAGLVMLRDTRRLRRDVESIRHLSKEVRDRNFRIFAEDGQVHAVSGKFYASDSDAFRLFEQILQEVPDRVDSSHAFYLGYEMCKASMANDLGKQYEQDESLDWGILTVHERSHRLTSRRKRASDR